MLIYHYTTVQAAYRELVATAVAAKLLLGGYRINKITGER